MMQVTIAVTIGENAAEGSIISVMNAETIPADTNEMEGLFLMVERAVERLGEDVVTRAKDQARQWARSAA